MEWNRLLSTQKVAEEEAEPRAFLDYPINAFEKDYSRIVSSAAFRRLQDKTQVFPLDKSDFIRTRLTHSMEVSAIARQLGIMVSKNTTRYRPSDISVEQAEDIASVLLCAGLLHDLGNPPFGHFGETVIGEWFQNNLGKILYKGTMVKDLFTEEMVSDLEHFEGNAQAFRILAKAKHSSEINVSAAVMSTLVKYPVDSVSFDSTNENTWKHKLGYYQAEREVFLEVADIVGTRKEDGIVCRHPLAYLLEAADDIAYATADLEDAFKKGLFTLQEFIDFFEEGYDHSQIGTRQSLGNYSKAHYSHELIENLKDRLREQPDSVAFNGWIKYTRRWLMHNVVFRFSNSYPAIMAGEFEKDLFSNINHTVSVQILKDAMREFVFDAPGIIKLELSAQTILSFLLARFVHAVLYYGYEDAAYKLTKADKKLLTLLSQNYRSDYETVKTGDEATDLYLRLLMVTDYISGMTDTYARTLYRELNGIE